MNKPCWKLAKACPQSQKLFCFGENNLPIKANVGIKGHCMKVHVLTETALGPQLPAAVVPIATYGELHPGSLGYQSAYAI